MDYRTFISLQDFDPTVKERQKHLNHYEIKDKYVIGYTARGEEFYFDIEDYDLVKDFPWRLSCRGYVDSNVRINGKRIHVSMHRLIMNPEIEMQIDHIGGIDTITDNRRSNLRIVDSSQNNKNRPAPRNNTSGCVGVSYQKKNHKWLVTIGKTNYVYLGLYADLNEAIRVRKEAEKKYFGEYSYDNSQKIKKEIALNLG